MEIKLLFACLVGKILFLCLWVLKPYNVFILKKFSIIAISVNPGFEYFDTDFLQKICDDISVPLFIEEGHIKEIVFDIRNEKKSLFFMC